MQIKTISKANFKKIQHLVENWSPEYRAHLTALVNKLDDENRRAYVAVLRNKAIGFLLYTISKRRDHVTINVDLTSVDPAHRNKGVATALKLHLASKHKTATITAEVNPRNLASVAVNAGLGATAVGHVMTMNPATMIRRATERQQERIRPVTAKAKRAISNIQKEKRIKEHGCPPGKGKIRGYTRKDGVQVASYCRTKR